MSSFKSLQEFLQVLEQEKELIRVKEEVSPELEITEITDRVCKKFGPALLFEKVKGYKIPVVTNLMGSYKRICLALRVKDLDELGKEVAEFIEVTKPGSFFEKLKLVPKLLRASNLFPKKVEKAPCQEIVWEGDEVDLYKLPILKCWPKDGGPFITLPCVITKDPETGTYNVGMYRMQVFSKNETGMHWQIHKTGAKHYRKAEKKGERLPVAVAIGPDPAIIYAATAPLPEDIDEFLLAGFLRRSPVELVKCLTVPLEVPAESQIVLEGYVEPFERRLEGPFGDHTGYYTPPDYYPVFRVTCITLRKDAIYPATIVGKPPQEDCFLGKATERLFLPLLKKVLPEIIDIHLPWEGVFHNLAFVSIDKRYPGHAFKVASALWGLGQMMFTKIIVVVDKEVNVQNISEVLFYMSGNVDPERDIMIVKGPVDALDHASPYPAYGSKMCIDATRKWREEGYLREWPEEAVMSDEIKAKVEKGWKKIEEQMRRVK
ncbi:menaquinone biosynthesis decarboxylase [Thermodesulfobacterium commune]|uniref:menaquinone biosynthesis decarboxylase n=1 Tax=Thermodesulfobacterium commune TaxID=1741 RepID=UPI002FD999A6